MKIGEKEGSYFYLGPETEKEEKSWSFISLFRNCYSYFFSYSNQLTDEQKNQRLMEDLKLRIKDVKERVEKLDNFIKQRPNLANLCLKKMQEHPEHIAYIKREDSQLDPKNSISQVTKLRLELVYEEHELSERIRFLKTHRDIWEVFKREVEQMQESDQQKWLCLTDGGNDFR